MNKIKYFIVCLALVFIALFARKVFLTLPVKVKIASNMNITSVVRGNCSKSYIIDDIGEVYFFEKGNNNKFTLKKTVYKEVRNIFRWEKDLLIIAENGKAYTTDVEEFEEESAEFSPIPELDNVNYIDRNENIVAVLFDNGDVKVLKVSDETEIKKQILEGGGWEYISFEYPIVQIMARRDYFLAIAENGDVRIFGEDGYAEPSIDGIASFVIPQKLNFKTKMVKISEGSSEILILDDEGQVYSWESDKFADWGQPKKMSTLSGIVDISCANETSMALDEKGTLYYWGINYKHSMGVKTYHVYYEPHVLERKNVKSAIFGRDGIFIMMENGDVKLFMERAN